VLPFVRLAALVGIVAPVAFALGLVLATWVNYDFMRELGLSVTDRGNSAWPSGLAQGPHGHQECDSGQVLAPMGG
jgi:hypothetical protein